MKTKILFGFINKTKLMALVFDWLKTKQIKTKETSPLSIKTKQISIVFSRNYPTLIAYKSHGGSCKGPQNAKKDFRGPKVMSNLSNGSKNFLGDAVMTFFWGSLKIKLIKTISH